METNTPTAGRALSAVEPRIPDPGIKPRQSPGAVGKAPPIPVFLEQESELHAPRTLSYQTPPGWVGVPLAGCASAALAEPSCPRANTANACPSYTALQRQTDNPPVWPGNGHQESGMGARVMGRSDENELNR